MSTRQKLGLALLFLFAFSTTALATEYYVKTPANGGDNANDGLAWATAKATISAAMALVNGSDNVHVAAGTYNERVTFHASNSNQLLGGYPAAGGGTRAPWTNQTIISGTSLTGSVISIPGNFATSVGYSGIVIDGFTVKNGSKSTAYGAGIESYSVGLTIKNCIVENNTSTGSGWVGGIYALALLNELSTRLLRIEACIIRNNTGPGAGAILIDAIAPFQLQLVNNLIYGNSSSDTATFLFGVGGVVIGTGSQMMASPPNNPKIINCTIANNTAAHTTKKVGGIGVNLDVGETVTIANSIIWHPGTGVDDIYAYNGETITLSYSDVEDAGDTGTGVIHSNPSFVSGSDYRLNAGSPCIDTGSNSVSGLPATDLDGNPRIADGDSNGTATVDMGAYEFSTPAGPPPDIDFNGDDLSDLAGLTSNGLIFYTTNRSTWTQIPGVLDQMVAGDFDGDDLSDLAGLTSDGLIFYTTDLSTWTQIPGVLSQLVVGDFNGDESSDLAGVTSGGLIFYTTNLSTWTQIPGALSQLVVGDFNGDGTSDLAGLTSGGAIFYTTDLSTWTQIPGALLELAE